MVEWNALSPNEIPAEVVMKHPLFNELSENEKIKVLGIDIPYIIKDRILMSPGKWHGMQGEFVYTEDAVKYGFDNTDWNDRDNRNLFFDHNDTNSSEWIGYVENVRLSGPDIRGDLHIYDMNAAIKMSKGKPKFGISPKIQGDDEKGTVTRCLYKNFSLVVNPAVKTAYINNMEVRDMPEEKDAKEIENKEQYPEPEGDMKKKKKYPEACNEEPENRELSEYTDFIKKYMKENPGTSVKDAADAWNKKENAAKELSDRLDRIEGSLAKIITAQEAKENQEEDNKKEPEEKEDEKESDTMENKELEEKVKELSEKVKSLESEKSSLENKLNEPDKITVRADGTPSVMVEPSDEELDKCFGEYLIKIANGGEENAENV